MTGLDWAIVAVYMAAVLAVGCSVGRHAKGTKDFFLAGRGAPLWAVVVSILATEISAATLVGVPAAGYAGGYVYLQTSIGALLSRVLLGWLVIGVFWKQGVTTVYEFLAVRYGGAARVSAAGVFLFGRLFASGVRLFIAALAFHGLTGMPLGWAIGVAGLASVVYGTIGGLEADIWTDVLQGATFLATTIFLVVVLLVRVGGPGEAMAVAAEAGRTTVVVADFRIWTAAFWANPYTLLGAVIGSCTLGLATHGTDQENVQRMLACRSGGRARWSVVLAGLVGLPMAALFASLGVLLFVFYHQHPAAAPAVPGDALLAFVRHEMPAGVAGLLVAAVFAAAMSSIDSTLNAMAAATVCDFYKPWWRPGRDEAHYLKASRWFSLGWGMALVGVAGGAAAWHSANAHVPLIDLALGVMNLFYGSLLGAFALGLFTRRGTSGSIAIGMAAGVVTTATLQFGGLVTLGWTWLIVAGTLATMAVGGAVRSPEPRSPPKPRRASGGTPLEAPAKAGEPTPQPTPTAAVEGAPERAHGPLREAVAAARG